MRCAKHPFDRGQDVCSHCGLVFCAKCLVYPGGAGKEALCIQCTVGRAVRSTGPAYKPVKRKELKARKRELAEYLQNAPETFEEFVELTPIHDPNDVPANTGGRHDRAVDWCA
jgi:hypothetical protein